MQSFSTWDCQKESQLWRRKILLPSKAILEQFKIHFDRFVKDESIWKQKSMKLYKKNLVLTSKYCSVMLIHTKTWKRGPIGYRFLANFGLPKNNNFWQEMRKSYFRRRWKQTKVKAKTRITNRRSNKSKKYETFKVDFEYPLDGAADWWRFVTRKRHLASLFDTI